jgi:hypothetical protein
MIITMPTPKGVALTEDEARALEGQWVTVLAFGEATLGQVETADAVELHHGAPGVGLLVDIREPAEEVIPTPLELQDGEVTQDLGQVAPARKATHINCEHDPAGINIQNAMVCSGDAT